MINATAAPLIRESKTTLAVVICTSFMANSCDFFKNIFANASGKKLCFSQKNYFVVVSCQFSKIPGQKPSWYLENSTANLVMMMDRFMDNNWGLRWLIRCIRHGTHTRSEPPNVLSTKSPRPNKVKAKLMISKPYSNGTINGR